MQSELTIAIVRASLFQLREPASYLLSLPSVGTGNAQETAGALRTIHNILTTMPDPELHLTTKLIAYIQHALNHVLLLCQNFLVPEKRFDFLVDAWTSCLEFFLRLPDGYSFIMGPNWQYDQMLFNVLFRIVDGLPVKSAQQPSKKQQSTKLNDSPKDRMSDETRLGALKCIILALPLDTMSPGISEYDQGYGSSIREHEEPLDDFGRARVPADDKVRGYLLETKSQPVLGQMIVILLDVAKDADLVALRKVALLGLLKLLKCLETPERIAPWIPGISAGLTKAMLERGLKENHVVLTTALDAWTFMVTRVLGSIGLPQHPLQNSTSTGAGLSESLMEMYKKQNERKSESTTKFTNASDGYGSKTWLKRTDHGLSTLFNQIAKLRTHSHWDVRRHFAEMSFRILRYCQGALMRKMAGSAKSSVPGFLLETLIGCTQDDFSDVSLPAKSYLGTLAEEYESQELADVGKQIIRGQLAALARILYGVNETIKQDAIQLAQGLVLFLGHQMEFIINQQTLISYLQPWTQVLTVEQLDQHNMDERRGILGVMAPGSSVFSPGSDEERWCTWVDEHKGSGRKFGFPRRIHLYLREQPTSDIFLGFLRQLGSTTEIDIWTTELTSRLQDAARVARENQGWFGTSDVSSVLMMNQLLVGASGIGLATMGELALQDPAKQKHKTRGSSKSSYQKKHQRHIKRAARGVLDEYLVIMVECSQLSAEAKLRKEMEKRSRPVDASEPNTRSKKAILARMFGMDEDEGEELSFEATGPVEYDHNTDVILRCLLLEGIASIAVILGGTEFELELVRVLYVLLEHLGDQDSVLIRDAAEVALEHVAFVCQYETIGDLIQANYDYVIQQISQRIAFLSTNPKTPQVLWALIHVVGPPAVTMLEDSVTEIFEALDHWKDQEDVVCEGLLKSLCEIVKVMAGAITKGAKTTKNEADPDITKTSTLALLNTLPSKEVENFAKEYRVLTKGVDDNNDDKALQEKLDSMTPEQIKNYFMERAKEAKQDEERLFGEREDENKADDSENAEDNEDISFGDLRASIPKKTDVSKPDLPTKQQALCLRILTKAGYFLTATSPRLRILALEIIQGSIAVLKDRPQELNPVIYGFWSAIVNRVLKRSELEVFYVSLRAIEVITALAENCSDFLGRHLLDDVWPFIVKALQTWMSPIDKDVTRNSTRKTPADERKAIKSGRPQQRTQGKVFTREHRLQMTTLVSVSKIVQYIRIPVQDIWMVLLLVKNMVLDREGQLHRDVRAAAAEVIRSMAEAGHGDSVYVVLDEVVQEQDTIAAQTYSTELSAEAKGEEQYGLQTSTRKQRAHIRFTTSNLVDSMKRPEKKNTKPIRRLIVSRGNAANRRLSQTLASFAKHQVNGGSHQTSNIDTPPQQVGNPLQDSTSRFTFPNRKTGQLDSIQNGELTGQPLSQQQYATKNTLTDISPQPVTQEWAASIPISSREDEESARVKELTSQTLSHMRQLQTEVRSYTESPSSPRQSSIPPSQLLNDVGNVSAGPHQQEQERIYSPGDSFDLSQLECGQRLPTYSPTPKTLSSSMQSHVHDGLDGYKDDQTYYSGDSDSNRDDDGYIVAEDSLVYRSRETFSWSASPQRTDNIGLNKEEQDDEHTQENIVINVVPYKPTTVHSELQSEPGTGRVITVDKLHTGISSLETNTENCNDSNPSNHLSSQASKTHDIAISKAITATKRRKATNRNIHSSETDSISPSKSRFIPDYIKQQLSDDTIKLVSADLSLRQVFLCVEIPVMNRPNEPKEKTTTMSAKDITSRKMPQQSVKQQNNRHGIESQKSNRKSRTQVKSQKTRSNVESGGSSDKSNSINMEGKAREDDIETREHDANSSSKNHQSTNAHHHPTSKRLRSYELLKENHSDRRRRSRHGQRILHSSDSENATQNSDNEDGYHDEMSFSMVNQGTPDISSTFDNVGQEIEHNISHKSDQDVIASESSSSSSHHERDLPSAEGQKDKQHWDIKVLHQLWKDHDIHWPICTTSIPCQNDLENYTAHFVFGSALPFPNSN
ncbi:TEL2-interacting protein 1 [Linnemannia zychae]|nr:TEL2-interacting protein 1 [Linnemannia zychae]